VTNDLVELKDMSTMCIKDFLRNHTRKQIDDDTINNDYRMLYQKEFFMQVYIGTLLRVTNANIDTFDDDQSFMLDTH
jgi:hypothetical protein